MYWWVLKFNACWEKENALFITQNFVQLNSKNKDKNKEYLTKYFFLIYKYEINKRFLLKDL